ncbi:MAG: DMT family transporter [Desulfovibrionaceae bacterium]|nr:DMT family transporter [Desulfovibrionaceae bacterium]
MRLLFSSKEEWSLCFVTMVWGMTFLVIRFAMQECGPFFFVGVRFGFAALILAAFSYAHLAELTKTELLAGILLGIIVYLGFGLQTAGLVSISAAKSAFLTAFYIPLVPLFEVLFLRKKVSAPILLGMALSFPGVLLISWDDSMGFFFGIGELETIVCAIVFAWEIIVIGMVAGKCDPKRLVTVEVIVTSLLAFATVPLIGEPVRPMSGLLLASAAGLGLVSAGMQSILAWAQKNVAPSRATLIYAGEPVWAGLFSFLAGEEISLSVLAGSILVICGVLVSNKS